MPREKYKSLSLKLKMELIKEVDSGGKRKDIAVKYGIPQSTLTTIYKSKDKIFSCLNNAVNLKSQKLFTKARNPEINHAVTAFINEARDKNVSLTGRLLR